MNTKETIQGIDMASEEHIVQVINNIDKQLSYIKSFYEKNKTFEDIIEEKTKINDIQNSIENIVNVIETTNNEEKEKNAVYNFVSFVEDNNTLLISEKENKVFLPYTVNELKEYINEYPEEYNSLSDVVNQEFIVPITRYKNQTSSRFRETYYLMRDVEMRTIIESFKKSMGTMFNSKINPAIIAACKSEEQLDTYVDCMEHNKLDEFKAFKIIFDVAPIGNIKTNEFDFLEEKPKKTNKKRGKHY